MRTRFILSHMKQRIQTILEQLNTGLIEREEPIRLALLSALSGEHLLLIGEPGTAKSVLARKLHLAFKDGEYFERLLTKFSVPEELFGPLSIKALENDSYLRLTDRYLPAASIAFIDEIFKANSAILNALLTILNEREFDNGDARVKVPLVSVIAASNELPSDEGLAALYDRFLCRYQVEPVSAQHFSSLLQLQDKPVMLADNQLFTKLELKHIQTQAEKINLPDEVLTFLADLRDFMQQKQIYVSDRRWRKVIKLLKVAAFTNAQSSVSIWDCYLLQHCLWQTPEQRQLIIDWYHTQVGMNGTVNLKTLDKLTLTWEHVLQQDQDSKVQQVDNKNRLLFINRQGEISTDKITQVKRTRDGDPLYLAPPDQEDRSNNSLGYTPEELKHQFFDDRYQQTHINGQWVHFNQYIADPENCYIEEYTNEPCMMAKKHSIAFIEGRLKETGNLAEDIVQLQQNLHQQHATLEQVIGQHLWLLDDFAKLASSSLNKAIAQTETLLSRLQAVMNSYQQLPRL